jgi:hypothetical protein
MFHRYQIEAAAKVVGGQAYTNALRGDGQSVLSTVPAAEQNRALSALLATINPASLAVPTAVLNMIPPRPFRYQPNPREVFKRHTGMTFDPLGPPEAITGMTLQMLLNPERCTRLLRQKSIDSRLPGLTDVLNRMRDSISSSPAINRTDYQGEIARMNERLFVEKLIKLAANKNVDGGVRAAVHDLLIRMSTTMSTASSARLPYLKWTINQYLADPEKTVTTATLVAPDGAPIDPGQEWLSPACDWEQP